MHDGTPLGHVGQHGGIHLLVDAGDRLALASALVRVGTPRWPVAVGPQEGLAQRRDRALVPAGRARRAVEQAGALVGVVAAVGGHDRRAEVIARLEPAGVGAEAVGQDRHVERLEVVPELVVGEVVVHVQVDAAARRRARAAAARGRWRVGGGPGS